MNGDDVAFPATGPDGLRDAFYNPGLTKRELFAAMAMQGLLSDSNSTGAKWAIIAEDAVKAADALLLRLGEGVRK